jgi:hypothetical protein
MRILKAPELSVRQPDLLVSVRKAGSQRTLGAKPVNVPLTASLQEFESGDCLVEAARTHVTWGKLCQMRGDHAPAREQFEKAAAQFEASGLERELKETHLDTPFSAC